MAQLFTVVQRKGLSPKVYNRGIYTTKKNLWEVWFQKEILGNPDYANIQFYDDTQDKFKEAKYSNMCNLLTENGRLTIFSGENDIALVTSAAKNEIRGWDVDENFTLVRNPATGGDEE
jgi:hypothetical protein